MKDERLAEIKFDERGLVPAVIQEADTGRVLMVAWMNAESLRLSLETGYTHFWSRSRGKLWKKGETSGHVQKIVEAYYDCDADTLLVNVRQTGPACHTGSQSCFFNPLMDPGGTAPSKPPGARRILDDLEMVIADRKSSPKEDSYVSSLFAAGREKICDKILEESREVIEASEEEDAGQVIYESADLIFHLMVLLSSHGISLEEIYGELEKRFGRPPRKGEKGRTAKK